MALNVGPSHPTTHGVLRLLMELDGDTITKCEPVIGYLHRGDEKIAENMTYNQFVPFTDRLDYLAPLANNVAYAIAVERLADITIPERCQALRVLICELARISSHLLGLGVLEWMRALGHRSCIPSPNAKSCTIYLKSSPGHTLHDKLHASVELPGDVPEGWLGEVKQFCSELPKTLEDVSNLLTQEQDIF